MKPYPFLFAFAAILLSDNVRAQVPPLVNYQGRVAVDAVNFEGAGQFKFALVSSDGTTTFWSNDGTSAGGSEPTAAVTLVVAKGLYSLLLGDTALGNMTTIPASAFGNADVRLRVWFNDGAHGSQLLTPDQRLAPAAYLADGTVTSASIGAAAVTSGKIASGAVSGTNIAPASLTSGNFAVPSAPNPGQVLGFDGNSLVWQTGTTGSNVFSLNGTNAFYNGGNVGIGTNNPTTKLDVRGSLTLEAGGSPVLFTGTGNAELNRYLLLGNSPTAQTGSGLKAGGILVSNDFSYANPGKSDLIVKGNVGIGGSESFGSSTRQMITLYDSGPNSTFGVGVQSACVYQRTGAGSGFAWFQAGVHNDTQYNPGAGGTARMILDGNGNLGIGSTTPQARLEVVGQDALRLVGPQPFLTLLDSNDGYAASRIQSAGGEMFLGPRSWVEGTNPNSYVKLANSGSLNVKTLTIRGGADLAEPFAMSQHGVPAGAVVSIDPHHPGKLKMSATAYDRKVAGIVSGANGINPGISMIDEEQLEAGENVALSGRVYVKANTSAGRIEPGDLLTTSDVPGEAMKAADHHRAQGSILGKAMTPLDEATGNVLVLVTLQ